MENENTAENWLEQLRIAAQDKPVLQPLLELVEEYLNNGVIKITLFLDSGIIQDAIKPASIRIVELDFDTDGAEPGELFTDEAGNTFLRIEW